MFWVLFIASVVGFSMSNLPMWDTLSDFLVLDAGFSIIEGITEVLKLCCVELSRLLIPEKLMFLRFSRLSLVKFF